MAEFVEALAAGRAGASAGPERVGLGLLWEPDGVLALQLQHALGVVQQRLARAVEERLLAGRVQIAELTLQRLVVQPMRIEAELVRHGSPSHRVTRPGSCPSRALALPQG